MSLVDTLMGGSGKKCPYCSSNNWTNTYLGQTCVDCGRTKDSVAEVMNPPVDSWKLKRDKK